MESINQLLHQKGLEIWSIGPDEFVFEAIRLMAEKTIGALIVIDDGRMVGIVSERDYARKVILQGKASKTTPVSEIMTSKLVTVTTHQSVDDCMSIMTARKVRHLPVVDGDELVGVLSLGDLVKSIIDDKQHTIEDLQHYISG